MSPQLSIIVACFNNARQLPKLLDSIRQQTLKSLEVIIADGGSDQPCDEVVERYKNAGLDIRLIKSRNRQYPLASRLAGFDVSKGEAIYFADADDALLSNNGLKTHVDMLLDNNLDIVNFRSVHLRQSDEGEVLKASPDVGLANALSGRKIFRTFLQTKHSYPNLWSKIFSRRLCEKIAHIPVLNHTNLYGAEDRLFTIVAMFHADSYQRSDIIGYEYNDSNNELVMAQKGICSLFIMIDELVPYLIECGCTKNDAAMLRTQLQARLKKHVRVLVENMVAEDDAPVPDEIIHQLLQYNKSIELMIKSFIAGHPAQDLRWYNSEEEKFKTSIAALKEKILQVGQ